LAFHIAFPNDEVVEQYTNHSQLYKVFVSSYHSTRLFSYKQCMSEIYQRICHKLKKRRKLNGKTKRLLKHTEHLDQACGTYSIP